MTPIPRLLSSRMRLTLSLNRFFARQARDPKNRVVFEKDITDVYGMPQPTFEYVPSTQYADEAGKMMNE